MTDARPQPQQTPATHKGANPGSSRMPPPLSPNGPNETEHGVIPPRPQQGPGLNGLHGGPGYSGMSSAGAFVDEANEKAAKELALSNVEAIEKEQEEAQEHQKKVSEEQKEAVEAQQAWEKEAVKGGGGDGEASTKKAFEKTKEEIEGRTAETGHGRYKNQK